MANPSTDRLFVSLVKEVCASLEIQVQTYHGGWVLTLKKGKQTEHVFGYDFSLNSAAAQQIAKDKSATFSILAAAKVPAVEHRLIMSPSLPDYMPAKGNWRELQDVFKRWNEDVVCKPNDGTGGRDVFRAQDFVQMERAIHTLLAKARACAISPYIEVADEFRVVFLDRGALLVYRKIRPVVIGDGKNRLIDLLVEWLGAGNRNEPNPDIKLKALSKMEFDAGRLVSIPKSGEKVAVNWRHNLGQGAAPEELQPTDKEWKPLVQVAQKTMEALRLRVASVDIVALPDGKLQVLEVNSGIMMEQFAQVSRGRALGVYQSILQTIFDESLHV